MYEMRLDLTLLMDSIWIWGCLIASFLSVLWLWLHSQSGNRGIHLPPGPRNWPIVGSLFILTQPLHECFAKLGERYGPIVYLRIGMIPTILINNAKLAREVLKTQDIEFAYRPDIAILRHVSFDYQDMGLAPYGDTWKLMRRISAMHLFTTSKLNMSASIRSYELKLMVNKVFKSSNNHESVNLTAVLHETILSVMVSVLVGKGNKKDFKQRANTLDGVINHLNQETLMFNIGDAFPIFRSLDIQRLEYRFKNVLMPQVKALFEEIIDEHTTSASTDNDRPNDLVDVLLRLNDADSLTRIQTIALLTDLFLAGLGTSESTTDFCMAELIRHPHILHKLRQEIDGVVDVDGRSRLVEEADLPNLPYLHAVIKETLRLHPALPLALPHHNPAATSIGEYHIPAKSTVFLNVWSIGRDPSTWKNPLEFKPERFLNREVKLGEDFEFMPFGAGRRFCAGYAMAMRTVPMTIATLAQGFDWKAEEEIDMRETTGAGMVRASPLVVNAVPRLAEELYESE